MRRILSLLLPVLTLACASAPPSDLAASPRPAPTSHREHSRIDAALASARGTARNVLVIYTADDCSWCEKMDREVWPDAKVQSALRQVEIVRVRKGEDSRPFEARWGSPGTPSFVVLRPDGGQAGDLLTGAFGRDDFLTYLAWAEHGNGGLPSLKLFGS